MGPEVDDAIADAGPLLHLYEIDRLSFLHLFSVLHVPDAVWDETVGRDRIPAESMEQLDNLRRHPDDAAQVRAFIAREDLGHLQYGEQACLWLLARQQAALVLTDDLAVREAVKQQGGTPVGSLGIIIRASRTGRIDTEEAERLLRRLHENSSLFVTDAIVDIAIEQLKRRS
ncbi:MAG: hypothetical protein GVY18_10135 [Bacteroidetes bacterium]|jgi:predicted nucleic acid-binding protein|nr:hypothetical protein [Bacteroidota bacterium]